MPSNRIHYSFALLLGIGALGLNGCGSGDGDSARLAQTVDASKNGVVETAITPNDGYVHINGSFQFDLMGKDKDGKETNLNNKATWTLNDRSLGSINNGLFTAAGKAGSNLVLTASYAGMVKEQPIILSDANLTSITISHSDGSIDVCKNTQFTAKALFSDGRDYDYPLTWSIDNASAPLASFADPAKPDLSTRKSGEVKVTASGKDNAGRTILSNQLEFSISDTLTKLTLASNKDLNMRQGQTATITVNVDYQNGTSATITPNASLTSNNTTALTVNPATGVIKAEAGSQNGIPVNLSASCNATTETLRLTILKPDIQTIEIVGPDDTTARAQLSVSVGKDIRPRLKVTYSDTALGSEIYSDSSVEWNISSSSFDYDESKITISKTTGELKVKSELRLDRQLQLDVRARIKTSDDSTAVNKDGNELKDTIEILVNP
jgi:hypothetical protein